MPSEESEIDAAAQTLLHYGLLLTALEMHRELSMDQSKQIPSVLHDFYDSVKARLPVRSPGLGPHQPPEILPQLQSPHAEVQSLRARVASLEAEVLRLSAQTPPLPTTQQSLDTTCNDDAVTLVSTLREENRALMDRMDSLHNEVVKARGTQRAKQNIEMELSTLHEKVLTLEQRERNVVGVVAARLPSVMSVIPQAHRDVMLPLLLVCCQNHSDASLRNSLARLVLSLFKRPDEEQRAILVEAIQATCQADVAGAMRLEMDFRAEIANMVTHKYSERRCAAVAIMGIFAPFIKPDSQQILFSSLLVPMVLSSNPECSSLVRNEIVSTAARLTDCCSGSQNVQENLVAFTLRLLMDSDEAVSRSAQHVLFPAVLSWSVTCSVLRSLVLPALLAALESTVLNSVVNTVTYSHLRTLLHALESCVPKFTIDVETWSFIPRVLKLATAVEVHTEAMEGLTSILCQCTGHLGESFGARMIVPILRRFLSDSSSPNRLVRCRALYIYLHHELSRKNAIGVKEVFIDVFSGANGWDSVGREHFFSAIGKINEAELPVLLNALWEVSTHVPTLRSAVADVLHIAVNATGCGEDTTSRCIIPLIIALAEDPDPAVRAASCSAIGSVITHVNSSDWITRLGETLASMVLTERADSTIGRQVLRVWQNLCTECPTIFREKFIIPNLTKVVTNRISGNAPWDTVTTMLLLEVFRSIASNLTMDDPTLIGTIVLPSLRALHKDVEFLDPHQKGMYVSLLRDLTTGSRGTKASDDDTAAPLDTASPLAGSVSPSLFDKIKQEVLLHRNKHNI